MNVKKIGLLCLALVLALGALGVGYASWTDTIFVDGTVQTGSVCINFMPNSWGENVCSKIPDTNIYPDKNWEGWLSGASANHVSCPEGYHFGSIACEDKDVAWVSFKALDADGVEIDPVTPDSIVKTLEVTIHDAYPHLLVDISFWVCNCGTIPVILQAPEITQSNFLLIEYGDNIGAQVHPGSGNCVEISMLIGVVQHEGYWVNGVWVVDDETQNILPQNNTTDVTFTVEIPAKQWAECDGA
jgi:hypothetical protein